MNEVLEIVLRAVDEASSIFSSVTGSAQEMGSVMESVASTTTSEFQSMETNVSNFQTAIDNVDDSTIEELAESLGMSTDEVERLIETGVEVGSIPFDEASAEAEELSSSISSISSDSIRNAADDTEEFEKGITNADESVNTLSNDLSIIDGAMLLQVGEQISQLAGNAEGLAQGMNEATITVEQLSIQTGIATPQLKDMVTTISNASFPQDEAMLYIKSLDQMQVSAENLGKSAQDIDAMNDAFGLGAQKTNSMAIELGVLGVDLNNVSDAFNALAYANANTAGGMDMYYQFLRKYDSQFKELGMDVDQTSVIIAAASQKWGGGKAALSNLNEVLKECGNDTHALEEALGLESGALDNATQLTGEYEGQLEGMADVEAQHKTFIEQLGDAYNDLTMYLAPVLEPLASAAGIMGEIGSVGMSIKGIKELGGSLKDIAAKIGLVSVAEDAETLSKEANTLASDANVIAKEAETIAAEEATVANEALAVSEGLALSPIIAIVAAIALVVAAVYELGIAMGWWDDFGGMMDAFYNNILIPIYNFLVGVFTPAWNFLGQVFNAIKPYIQALADAFNMFMNGQMDLPSFIMSIMTNVFNIYTTIFSMVIQALVKFGGQILSKGVSATVKFVNGIMTRIKQLPGKVYSALINVVSRIRSAIQSWITAAVAKVKDLISKITSPFSGVASSISSALSGVANAISAPFRNAWNALKPYVDKIKSGIDTLKNIPGNFMGGFDAAGFDLEEGSRTPNQTVATDLLSGEDFDISTGEIITRNETHDIIDVNYNISLELKDVPSNINSNELIELLKDKDVLSSLTGNPDFQSLDAKVKAKIASRQSRAAGR